MADEIRVQYPSGDTAYAKIRNESGQVADLVAEEFVAWNDEDIADYKISLADSDGDEYIGDIPAWVKAIDGVYDVIACLDSDNSIISTGQTAFVNGVEQTIPEVLGVLYGILMDRIRAGRAVNG